MPGTTDETVSNLLQDGESRVDATTVGDVRVVLTSRRLLVVRDAGSPRLRAVDRVNVGSVRTETAGGGSLLGTLQWAGLGAFFLAAWQLAPLGVFERSVTPPSGVGFGGLFGAVNVLLGLLALLDEAFLVAGVLAVGWAVVHLARSLAGRRRVLELTVTGEDPIRFPSAASEEAADRLRALVSVATGGRND